MSKASHAKKREKRKLQAVHPTKSFDEMMGNAQLNALKPHIHQLVTQEAFAVQQRISHVVMDFIAPIQTRMLALEKLLQKYAPADFTQRLINAQITEVEDEALGLVEVTKRGAQAGDTIRMVMQSRSEKETEYCEPENIRIESLLNEANGKVQTLKDIETILVDTLKGEDKEFMIPGEVEEGSDENPVSSFVKLTVDRISCKPENLEIAKAEELEEGEAEEAPETTEETAESTPTEVVGDAPEEEAKPETEEVTNEKA